VFLQPFQVREHTCAFDYDIHTGFSPGQLGGVFLVIYRDFLPGNHQVIPLHFHRFIVSPINRIESEQVCQVVDRGDIVYRQQVKFGCFKDDFKRCSTDPSQSIDRYRSHRILLSVVRLIFRFACYHLTAERHVR
jgi:hypothetical protein